MKIFPAVDIREGRAVRLREGDYSRMTVYGDPVLAARSFLADGAGAVHVVDLDGALTGRPENAPVVAEIAALGMETEIGGGIRSRDSIEMYLAAGASRVILGTVAAEDPAFAEECIRAYGDRIAVGVDARDGKVAVRGWKTLTDLDAYDFCMRFGDAGVGAIVYTDISRDGMLSGMNIPAYCRLAKTRGLRIVASGGLTKREEIAQLAEAGVYGAILGKAMYEGVLPLKDALAAAKEASCSQNA